MLNLFQFWVLVLVFFGSTQSSRPSQDNLVESKPGQFLDPIWFAVMFVKISFVEGCVWQTLFVFGQMWPYKKYKKKL